MAEGRQSSEQPVYGTWPLGGLARAQTYTPLHVRLGAQIRLAADGATDYPESVI